MSSTPILNAAATDENVTSLVNRIVDELQKSMLNVQLQKAAQAELTKAGGTMMGNVQRGVAQALIRAGWEKKLRNAVFKCMHTYTPLPHIAAPQDHQKEPCTYIRRAQGNWEKRILKSLNSMCTELSVPLARKRPEKEQKDMMTRWTELGTDEPGHHNYMNLSQFRPVYAPKDFLEVIASLKNPNTVDCGDTSVFSNMWGVIQASLKVKDLHALRLQYSEMSINQCQNGVDDSPEIPLELFEQERTKLARKVLAMGSSPLAQEFSKKGCQLSFRSQIWCQILGVDINEVDILYYDQLKACVLQHDLLVDSLIYKDVKLTAANDDQYFVFEDYLYQVLLPFARDTTILKHFSQSSATPAKSYIRGKLGVEDFAVTYPPNGVIPFHGFAMYVCPLCYIYNDCVTLYFVFREMYTRFFYRLHTLSSHPQGIVALCLQFETLLQTQEPQLFFHLKSIGVQPLRIAFKWLIRAFSGYLSSEQVLLLWDRILAYNSLEILAVLALAIFEFRKTNLMQVQTFNAAEAVLSDITTLKVIPLIQLTLFSQ